MSISNISETIIFINRNNLKNLNVLNFNKTNLKIKLLITNQIINIPLNDYKILKNIKYFSDEINNIINKSNNLNELLEKINNISEKKKKSLMDLYIKWTPYYNINFDNNDLILLKLKKQYPNNFNTNIIFKELDFINKSNLLKFINIDNITNFKIILLNFKNDKINTFLKEKQIEGITINININIDKYPNEPPNIYFYEKFENYLDFNISNCKYFNKSNWNPTNTLLNMLIQIHEIINNKAPIIKEFDEKFRTLDINIHNLIKNNISILNTENFINLDFIKIQEIKENNSYWNSGIGYGNNLRKNNWDINNSIKNNEEKNNNNLNYLQAIHDEIKELNNLNLNELKNYLNNSNFIELLYIFILELNIDEFDKKYKLYNIILNNINLLIEIINDELINKEIYKKLENFIKSINIFLNINKTNIDNIYHKKSNDKHFLLLNFSKLYNQLEKFSEKYNNSISNISNHDIYINTMKELLVDDIPIKNYSFKNFTNHGSISKISKQLSHLNSSLPLDYNSSIFIRYDDSNCKIIKCLITGPKDTPYQDGCYIFDIYMGDDYPNNPPKVLLTTTGKGSVRFNPNLYNCGKVCLSLLGTWRAEGGETWNPNISTLLQVLISIQALIFVEKPYFNEPGYERDINNERGKSANFNYNDNIRFNNIKWAILDNIKYPQEEFKDVIKNHFKIKKNDIKSLCNNWLSETKLDKNKYKLLIDETFNLLDNY